MSGEGPRDDPRNPHGKWYKSKECDIRGAEIDREYPQTLTRVMQERDALREAVREAYEVWAGSDGFIPQTAPEAYQKQLVEQIADILGKALAGDNAATADSGNNEEKDDGRKP